MNEFCREKIDPQTRLTRRQAQAYISRNIEEYRLMTASNWQLTHGYI